jgi:3-methyladenine DNA glycosylase AlkC
MKIQVTNDRAKYIQRKVQDALNATRDSPSPAVARPTDKTTKNNEHDDW